MHNNTKSVQTSSIRNMHLQDDKQYVMRKDKHVKIHDKILIHTQNGNTCPEIIIQVWKVLKIYCKENELPRGRSLKSLKRAPRNVKKRADSEA